jgi:hypothetical protein
MSWTINRKIKQNILHASSQIVFLQEQAFFKAWNHQHLFKGIEGYCCGPHTQSICYGWHSPASDDQQCWIQLLKCGTWLWWLNISSSLLAVVTSAWSNNLPINIFRRVICSLSVNGSHGPLGIFCTSLLKLWSNLDTAGVGRFCSNASCKEQLSNCDAGCGVLIRFNSFKTGSYKRLLVTLPLKLQTSWLAGWLSADWQRKKKTKKYLNSALRI